MADYEILTTTDLDYLLGSLRLHLGDTSVTPVFTDGMLRKALVDGFKSLGRRWNYRYLISSTYTVSRSTTFTFMTDSPPVIMIQDEIAVILSASILLKSGSLYSSSYSSSFGSWRDDELSYSNIQSGTMFRTSITDDQSELNLLFPFRTKLYGSARQGLPGFSTSTGNYYEGGD